MTENRAVRKIALILAGGVSLGSYEAGVLTELLYALETLNATAQQEGRPRYVLDVMTGGSAGGLTAALVAQIMLYDLAGRKGDLYRAWVKDIDIVKLLDKTDMPLNALFSKKAVQDIVYQYVVHKASAEPKNPASFAPRVLRLSLSLSNMHGIDYRIPYFSSTSQEQKYLLSTFFSDMARFTIHAAQLPSQAEWQNIGEAAIASGTFPFAFQPHQLHRNASDYPGSIYEEQPELLHEKLCFIDGGLFDNEPLSEAISQAKEADGGVLEPTRLFILVDPNLNISLQQQSIAPEDSLQNQLKRILTMIQGESTARDWFRAHRTNTELEWRDQLVQILAQIIETIPPSQAQQIAASLTNLTKTIIKGKRSLIGEQEYPDNSVQKALGRTLAQHPLQDLYRTVKNRTDSEVQQEIFRNMVFVLNNICDLQNKAELRLALIGAEKSELVGDQLYGFGGFFDETWRTYDFRIGREKAHELLPHILSLAGEYPKETDENGQLHADYIIPQEWRDTFPNMTIKHVNRNVLDALRQRVLERADYLLEELHVARPVRWLLKRFYIKNKIEAFLEQSSVRL